MHIYNHTERYKK